MPGSLSDYAEKLLLDYMLTTNSVTRPTTLYLGLFTSATDDAAGGTEVSGNGYARQAITFGAAATPGGVSTSSNSPTFTAAGGNWGTISYMRIYDAVTAGNGLFYGALTTSRIVNDGDTISFPVGSITLTLD